MALDLRSLNIFCLTYAFQPIHTANLNAIKALGRSDIKIVTMDLDSTCALDMAQGGNIVGIACDMPYAMGFGRALMAAYGCIGGV